MHNRMEINNRTLQNPVTKMDVAGCTNKFAAEVVVAKLFILIAKQEIFSLE